MAQTPVGLLSIAEFDQLAAAGALAEDARVELVQGRVVEMNPIGPLHARCVDTLGLLFAPLALAGTVVLRMQNPLALSAPGVRPGTERYPGLALLRPRADRYRTTPTAADTLLVVEVSDSSLAQDLTEKVPLYAAAGVPRVLVVDLAGERILDHRDPAGSAYATVREYRRGSTLAPLDVAPALRLDVSTVLD